MKTQVTKENYGEVNDMQKNMMQCENDYLKNFSFHKSGGSCPIRIVGYTLMQSVICNFGKILKEYNLLEMVGDYCVIVRSVEGILGGKGGYEVLINYKCSSTTIWVEKIKGYDVKEQTIVYNYSHRRIISDTLHMYDNDNEKKN